MVTDDIFRLSATIAQERDGAFMNDETALRRKTATLTRMLNLQGTIGMFGHVSVRVPGTDRILLSPAAAPTRRRYGRTISSCSISTATSFIIPAASFRWNGASTPAFTATGPSAC